MRLYHTTSADCADIIMADGFRDNATKLMRPAITYTPRVWFAPMPAIGHSWFDADMMWADQMYEAFITIDVPLPFPPSICSSEDPKQIVKAVTTGDVVAGIVLSDIEWPSRQYWGPAEFWNRFPRTRFTLDDAIRLRLTAEPALIGKMKQRLMMGDYYDRTEFIEALVQKILVEDFHVEGQWLIPQRPSYLDQPSGEAPPMKPQFRQPPRKPNGKNRRERE